MNSRYRILLSIQLLVIAAVSAYGAAAASTFTGVWQLSWEARIGTENGTLRLHAAPGGKLTGTFAGRQAPIDVVGQYKGDDVSFELAFPATQPYTIVFGGSRSGDKMSGRFSLKGMSEGYDSHGENVRPTNYTWTATRQRNTPKAKKP